MKKVVYGFLLLCGFLASCTRDEVNSDSGRIVAKDGYYTLQVGVTGISDDLQTYAAESSHFTVPLRNLTMVVVDTVSTNRPIVDTAIMHRISSGSEEQYTFRIPATVDLGKVRFYALANAYNQLPKTSNLDLTDIEGRAFEELLARKILVPATQNEGVELDSYVLMNPQGVPMNRATQTLPPIRLQHLPARVFFDCSSLSGRVTKVRISQVSSTTSLKSLYRGALSVAEDTIYDLEDPNPGIAPNRADYYYLVYPSGRESELLLEVEMEAGAAPQQKVVKLGTLESGRSYNVKINALRLSFSGDVSSLTVELGSDMPVTLEVFPGLGSREVTWTSSDESIFTVTKDAAAQNKAIVKGLKEGRATLTATCERASATLEVVVAQQGNVMHMLGRPIIDNPSGIETFYIRQKGGQRDSTKLKQGYHWERMYVRDSTMYTYVRAKWEGNSGYGIHVAKVSLRDKPAEPEYFTLQPGDSNFEILSNPRLGFTRTQILCMFNQRSTVGLLVFDYSGNQVGSYPLPFDKIQQEYGPAGADMVNNGIGDIYVDDATGRAYFAAYAQWNRNWRELYKGVNLVYEYKEGEDPFASAPVHVFDTGDPDDALNGGRLGVGRAENLKVIDNDFYIVTSRTSIDDGTTRTNYLGLKNGALLFKEKSVNNFFDKFNPDFVLHNGTVYTSGTDTGATGYAYILTPGADGRLVEQPEQYGGTPYHVLRLIEEQGELYALAYDPSQTTTGRLPQPSFLYRGLNDTAPMTFDGRILDFKFQ